MSFRSPIIFALNGKISKGVRKDAIIHIHSADIPATILDYVGIDIPEDFYGVSYRDVIEGEKETIRSYVQGNVITTRSFDPNNFMGRHVEGYWVRKDNWFLRWHVTDDELELYNLSNDLLNEKKGDDPRIAL